MLEGKGGRPEGRILKIASKETFVTLSLDIRTITFLLALGDLAAIGIILAYGRRSLRDAPLTTFLIGKSLQGAAWALFFVRGSIPGFYSVFVGNALLFSGIAMECLAIGTVRGRDSRQELAYGLILAIGYPLFIIFSTYENSRVTIASLICMSIYAHLSYILLRKNRASPLVVMIGIASGIYALALSARAVIAAPQESFLLFARNWVQYLAFLPQFLALVLGTLGFLLLVKERDDERLVESEGKYRSVTEHASEAIVLIQEGLFVYANRRAIEMAGYASVDELIGTRMEERILPEDKAYALSSLERWMEEQKGEPSIDFRLLRADGSSLWVSTRASLLTYKGRTAVLALISDIDERKRQQERIEKLLAEKELLLREVNHRVKNNLGVAISLLSLQTAEATNRPAGEMLVEAQARLATMSELYESLHRVGSSAALSIRDYLPRLVEEVTQLFPRTPPVSVEIDLDDIVLDAHLLSPLGIILNELMTNSLRHAFEGIKYPKIFLAGKLEEGRVHIRCGDNGKGLPEGFDPSLSTGFGSSVILALAGQMNCSLRIERGEGTVWHLEFAADSTRV